MGEAKCRRPRSRWRVPCLLGIAALLALHAAADGDAASPPGVQITGARWGVTSELSSQGAVLQQEISLIQGLGIADTRYSFRWSDVQPTDSSTWDWGRSDAGLYALWQGGFRVWAVVESGCAGWATDTGGRTAETPDTADSPPLVLPRLDEPITGAEPYYLFVRALVTRYHGLVDAWLIDNEPSESWSWAADSDTYARMVRVAAAAVHEADPDAVVALGSIPLNTVTLMVIADRLDDPAQESFIVSYASRMWGQPVTIDSVRLLFADSGLRFWERVEFYRQAMAALPLVDAQAGNVLGLAARGALAPDIVWSYQDQMRAHGGGVKPLLFTELNPYLEDPLASARETTQLMIGLLASGAVRAQSYLELADGSVPTADDPNCGLVTPSLQPKPGYSAYRTLITQLWGRDLAGRLSAPAPVTGYWFQSAAGPIVYVLWAPSSTTVDLTSVLPQSEMTLVSMVGSATTVEASAIPVEPSPCYVTDTRPYFYDVGTDSWAFAAVQACVAAGIVTGYADGEYRPAAPITRDQVAVFLARAEAGGDESVPTDFPEASFPDVPTTHWAYRYVEYARAQGVLAGYPDGLYHGERTVDRGQMAVLIMRALTGGAPPPTGPDAPTFPDVTPDGPWAWASAYVEYAVARGVIGGYPDGLYHPEVACTRDQMATFIARACGLLP